MTIVFNLLSYIKGIFLFKKYSYVVLSFVITLTSKPFIDRLFDLLKLKLDTEDVILNMLISMGVFFTIFIVISFDTITGLMAAKYEKQSITTTKGLSSVFKMIFYSIWIMIILLFQIMGYVSERETLVSILGYIMFFSASLIILWEVRSIGNNLERRFDKHYAFFTLIDKIIDILERKVGVYLENTICKISPKNTKDEDNA